jgi:Holliday junction resolvasome RuvABC endonuclease subunit
VITAIGIDPAVSKPTAIASLDEQGNIRTREVNTPGRAVGARRLHMIRSVALPILRTFSDVAVVTVETPMAVRGQQAGMISLLQCQGVLLEAAQHAHPGAVVLDSPPTTWKKWSVGSGNASKAEYIAHAQGLGLDSDDEDLCAAVCMAQSGLEKWLRETARQVA